MNVVPSSKVEATAEGLSELFRRYRRALAKAVARIVRPSDVEDIVQETYLRVFQAAQQRPIQYPRAFMLTAARNAALNHIAGADALNHLEATHSSIDQPAAELDEMVEGDRNEEMAFSAELVAQAEEEFLTFCHAVRGLPIQCRRVFILKKVYGFSQREIAKDLGLSESTVEKHIAKGLAACSAYMVERGYARGKSTLTGDSVTTKGRSV